MNTIVISKTRVKKEGGVIILPLKEYEKLRERAVPIYYLTGKAARNLDKLVEGGLKAYSKGETIGANSLRQALRIYERQQNKRRSVS